MFYEPWTLCLETLNFSFSLSLRNNFPCWYPMQMFSFLMRMISSYFGFLSFISFFISIFCFNIFTVNQWAKQLLLNFLFAQSFLLGSVTNLTFSQLWPKNSHKVVNYMWFLNSFLQRKIIYLIVETPEIKFLKHSFCLRLFYTIEFLLTQHKKKKTFQSFIQKRFL